MSFYGQSAKKYFTIIISTETSNQVHMTGCVSCFFMNLHYKDHHHQRYCDGAQKIQHFAHKFSRLCFSRQSCTYKVRVIVFAAIEMQTSDITGSHSLTKTASYCERRVCESMG